MFDFDKTVVKLLTPFVAVLMVVTSIWICVRLIEQIWLSLLIIVGALGIIACSVALVWLRFRRW